MPGPLQQLSPPFLMTSTMKQMRPNGRGGGVLMRLCQSNDIMYTKKLSLKTHYRRQKFAYLPKNEKLLELVLVAVMFSNDIRSLSCLQKCGNHFFLGHPVCATT